MIATQHRFHGHTSLMFAYKRGVTLRNPQLALKYIRNDRRNSYRVAVVVSRKVDKSAVVRNRIRRRVYEIVRAYEASITTPYDLVFTAFSSQLATLAVPELRQLVVGQLRKAGVVTTAKPAVRAIVKTESKG